MKSIAETMHKGQVQALIERINNDIYHLSCSVWDSRMTDKKYVRLGQAINEADRIIADLKETFKVLEIMEPNKHK